MILNSIEVGSGPPVVLLHGLFGAARNLGQVARGLGAQARVVSMDMRNHADSPHDPDMDYAVMAADVAETMSAHGIDSAPVVGHSMGGKIAMSLALAHAERVERLVVMDIAPVTYNHGYDGYVEAMKAIPLTNEMNRREANEFLAKTIDDAPLRLFLLSNLILGPNPHWRFGLDEIGAAMHGLLRWSDPPGVKPYAGPALFLRGSKSDYVLPEMHETILELFPAAKFETVENAAHWVHADQPKAVIAALQAFLF